MNKLLTLSVLFLLFTFCSFGRVITVSNHPMMGSQDSTLVQAYSDASIGDTLLLEGTDIPYEFGGDLDPWNKSLVVIGIGINPQNGVSKDQLLKAVARFHFIWDPTRAGRDFMDWLLKLT